MSDIVIKVDNLSKQYRLGKVGTGTLAHDLNRWWAKVRGKEDPYLKIGSENKRDEKGDSDYVWALRDINFEVKEGEVLGIIGKNGAGKSTLLKILSRVTAPSGGELKIKGRIASLLEVGTGFHPELTGKENIFLNGAILGMTKQEIKSKYDEIVEFSGVERYIDTPVKRYSSGMYVRLAFAVAAHLEPEILVVDEVLAVGDAEFQKKCLGKMKDVAGGGRTVLFVSHNLMAVSTICSRVIYLNNGRFAFDGNTSEGIELYLSRGKYNNNNTIDLSDREIHLGPMKFSQFLSINVLNARNFSAADFKIGESIKIQFQFELKEDISDLEIGCSIKNMMGVVITTFVGEWEGLKSKFGKGKHLISCKIERLNCFPGTYSLTPWLKRRNEYVDDQVDRAFIFNVIWSDVTGFAPNLGKYSSTGVFIRSEWTAEG